MTYEQLMAEIEKLARFESLIQLPEKRDPDWPKWAARASIPGHATKDGLTGQGETDIEALEQLLENIKNEMQSS